MLVFSVVKNRETRLPSLLAYLAFIPTYFFLLPYLQMMPTAIFNGLFLYIAYSSMVNNELLNRSLLLITEQVTATDSLNARNLYRKSDLNKKTKAFLALLPALLLSSTDSATNRSRFHVRRTPRFVTKFLRY